MLKRLRQRQHNESGQTIVTVALLTLFIVAILAVVVESGSVYIQRRNLQNAADAAALAAAQELYGVAANETPAVLAANNYASGNVTGLESVQAAVRNGYTEVEVVVQKKAATAFAGWLSFGEPLVAARATARVASFNIIRCVVPLAVQDTAYFAGTTNYPADPLTNPPPLVELKTGLHEGAAGSNTGLVDLGPGNSSTPIRQGSACGLSPMIKTKPGLTTGDVKNGFTDRLQAAMANNCYTWAEVLPPANGGTWRCKPEAAVVGGIQASAVVLLPVLSVNIGNSGSGSYPLTQLGNGQYLLAYFWVDGNATYDTTRNNWPCIDHPDCVIRGRFIMNVPVDAETFDPSKCPGGNIQNCIVNFDPGATTRIVQLID